MQKKILHIAPHHDDIFLGYYPLIKNKKYKKNTYIIYLTSGINAVSDEYVYKYIRYINDNINLLNNNKYLSSPLVFFKKALNINNKELAKKAKAINILNTINKYKNENNIVDVYDQNLFREIKKSIRIFEAESVWYYIGIKPNNIIHLDLPFYYTKNISSKDVELLLIKIKKINPDIIYTINDPKKKGPENHYKSKLLLKKTLGKYNLKKKIKILGYRNVWSDYVLKQNIISSLNKNFIIKKVCFDDIEEMKYLFEYCFESQYNALFPSKEYKDNFAEIMKKKWKLNKEFAVRNGINVGKSQYLIFLKKISNLYILNK